MNFIAGMAQGFIGALIAGAILYLAPLCFTRVDVHPDDTKLPFRSQRVKLGDTGEQTDFAPRQYIWAEILLAAVAAACWIGFTYHYGLLGLT